MNIEITNKDIRNMVFECIKGIMNESVSSIVYHYTHPSSLINIIKTNELETSDDIEMPNGKISYGGFSVTRQRNDRIGYAVAFRNEFFDGAYIRLELDGDLLNCNFKSKPVDEFGQRGNMNVKDWNYESSRLPFMTQAEDRIYTNNHETIKNAIRYIKRIDIMVLCEDERYNPSEIENFLNELYKLAVGTKWEEKIYIYFDDYMISHRNHFNYQTNDCYRLKDIEGSIISESKDSYDTLYRGVSNNQLDNKNGTWLTTSKEYASLYGKVGKYKIKISILDGLAKPSQALKYLIRDVDGYPFYEEDNFDINKMKEDGFTGYYYEETEYKCLNVFLFK